MYLHSLSPPQILFPVFQPHPKHIHRDIVSLGRIIIGCMAVTQFDLIDDDKLPIKRRIVLLMFFFCFLSKERINHVIWLMISGVFVSSWTSIAWPAFIRLGIKGGILIICTKEIRINDVSAWEKQKKNYLTPNVVKGVDDCQVRRLAQLTKSALF